MPIETETKTLLGTIERRLSVISEQQHALAAEKAHLLEQLTPLRLGIVTSDTVVVQLKAKGITLRGLTVARPARHPRPVVLKAVASIHPAVSVAR